MRKIIAVVLWAGIPLGGQPLRGNAPSVGMQASHNQKQKSKPVTGDSTRDQRGTKDVPLVVDIEGHKKTPAEQADAKRKNNDNEYSNRWTLYATIGSAAFAGLAALFTGFLVCIGRDGVKAARDSLKKIGEQTEIALLNAKAVINAERPWMVISVEPLGENEFVFRATNVGRTPANITAIWSESKRVNRDEVLALPDGYYSKEGLFGFNPELLPATVHRDVGRCNLDILHGNDPVDRWIGYLNGGFANAYHCGKIIYRDVLDPREEHETKWVYWYLSKAGTFIPDPSHAEWNNHT